MSAVILEFDNTLEKSDIVMPLISSSKDEAGDDYMNTATDKAQTAVFGIQVPLIMINNTIIDFDAIQYFNLKSILKSFKCFKKLNLFYSIIYLFKILIAFIR